MSLKVIDVNTPNKLVISASFDSISVSV